MVHLTLGNKRVRNLRKGKGHIVGAGRGHRHNQLTIFTDHGDLFVHFRHQCVSKYVLNDIHQFFHERGDKRALRHRIEQFEAQQNRTLRAGRLPLQNSHVRVKLVLDQTVHIDVHQLGARRNRFAHDGRIAEEVPGQSHAPFIVRALFVENGGRTATDVVNDLNAVGKGGQGKSIENDHGVVDAIALATQPPVHRVGYIFQAILEFQDLFGERESIIVCLGNFVIAFQGKSECLYSQMIVRC